MACFENQADEILIHPNETQEEEENDTLLDQTLQRLETFLFLFGFFQSSPLTFFFSWTAFLLVGISIPVVIIELCRCSGCERFQIARFELRIFASQASLAAVSLLCISHNLRKHGLRKFLFVDRCHGHMIQFRKEYIEKIKGFFRVLVWWMLPCFILKTALEITRTIYLHRKSRWQDVAILLALLVSWTYLTTIFLSSCLLFNLVCNLQVIHFEYYGYLFGRNLEELNLLEEHIRLRHHLSKISHRFRIYLLLAFLVVTASQFVTLLQTMGFREIINLINGGDFAVSSIVEVVGIILCLLAAAKISHRAQGIASIASRWHALETCNSNDGSQLQDTNGVVNNEAAPPRTLLINFSESDLESINHTTLPSDTQSLSHISSYNKRMALVTYLQSNPGGLTIFGWTVDRTLINTIFFIELSLVLFVLGKTIAFTSK